MNTLKNEELGLSIVFWDGKQGRMFLAAQILPQLGYRVRVSELKDLDLEEGIDMKKVSKKEHTSFMKKLFEDGLIGERARDAIFLSESGLWKLIMQSKMPIGIKTRNWLAREVLPSIQSSGSYNVEQSEISDVSGIAAFTERSVQLENSKSVNSLISQQDKDFRGYHDVVHKAVSGMNAKEIRMFYQDKGSARELLRKYAPELATTEAMIDELYKMGVGLANIFATSLHRTMPAAVKSLLECGIRMEDFRPGVSEVKKIDKPKTSKPKPKYI